MFLYSPGIHMLQDKGLNLTTECLMIYKKINPWLELIASFIMWLALCTNK